MACNSLAIQIVSLIFTFVALILSIGGCLSPLFTISDITGKSTSPDPDAVGKAKMTFWSVKVDGAKDSVELRTKYFICSEGKLNVQAAEGVIAVVCVLGAANLILCIFLFLFKSVIKFPLALYEFFAAGGCAAAFGIMLHLYLNGWCGGSALKADGWSLAGGVPLVVVSCILYLVCSVLCIFA